MIQRELKSLNEYPVGDQQQEITKSGGEPAKPRRKRLPRRESDLNQLVAEFQMKREKLIARYQAKMNKVMFRQ